MKYGGIRSYIGLLCGVLALSMSAIFVKIADAPSAATAFYRLLIALVVLTPFLICSKENMRQLRGLRAKQCLIIALSGILLAVHYIMWFESLRYTSVASSTVLVSLQPIYAMLFGLIFLKEKLKKSDAAGCAIALLGSVIIGWGDLQLSGAALWGDILALLSAGVVAAYFLIGQVVRKSVGAVVYSVPSYLCSVVFLLAYALAKKDPLTGFSTTTWAAFFGVALVSTVGGQFVFNLLLKNMTATAVTMGILGEPIGTCTLAYFILGDTIAPRQLIGILTIMLGLAVFFFYPLIAARRRKLTEQERQTEQEG